jgi:hypothetical protein
MCGLALHQRQAQNMLVTDMLISSGEPGWIPIQRCVPSGQYPRFDSWLSPGQGTDKVHITRRINRADTSDGELLHRVPDSPIGAGPRIWHDKQYPVTHAVGLDVPAYMRGRDRPCTTCIQRCLALVTAGILPWSMREGRLDTCRSVRVRR